MSLPFKWIFTISVPFDRFAVRSTDFAPLIKKDGIWRVLEDHEIIHTKVMLT